MSDMNVSRIGQINQTGDENALFLKVFAGEVLTAFRETNVFMSRSMVRTISSGKSAQFPATGKTTASYHTPGQELTGGSMNHAERVITIDDLLVADLFLDILDDAKNHYDVRNEYSTQAGRALARSMDQNLAQVGVLAARASATVSGLSGGSQVDLNNASYDASDLIGGIQDAAQALDEKDVPEQDRFCFLRPKDYRLLTRANNDAINSDTISNDSGVGVDTGRVFSIGGVRLVKSNNVPNTNVTSGPSAYQGNFSNTLGVVWHRSAVGTVKLIDLATEMAYLIQNQGWLLVAKMAVGHGILRPESAVEIEQTA